jgi:hypothetical protein
MILALAVESLVLFHLIDRETHAAVLYAHRLME